MHYFLNPYNSVCKTLILYPSFLLFLYLFEIGLAMYPSWPGTCNSSASASWELGLHVWTTMPGYTMPLYGGGNWGSVGHLFDVTLQGRGSSRIYMKDLYAEAHSAMALNLLSNYPSFQRWGWNTEAATIHRSVSDTPRDWPGRKHFNGQAWTDGLCYRKGVESRNSKVELW